MRCRVAAAGGRAAPWAEFWKGPGVAGGLQGATLVFVGLRRAAFSARGKTWKVYSKFSKI